MSKETTPKLQHFILTRFNLLLWRKSKDGNPVRTLQWLDHRFSVFERYCLPSILGQTCKDFVWIVLFDNTTPDKYKVKVEEYKNLCPQFVPVFVEPREGRNFAQIFRSEVLARVQSERVLTTYLDNDDALNRNFVEDVQRRALDLADGTFINYTHGYQFFTDYNYVMRIKFPANHFQSVVEQAIVESLKTIYGYGSHSYVHQIPEVKIVYVQDSPMWCEVVHEKNMGNDAYFLFRARMVDELNLLKDEFSIDESVRSGVGLYLFRFIPRYIKTFFRRVKYFLFGRKW